MTDNSQFQYKLVDASSKIFKLEKVDIPYTDKDQYLNINVS